MITPDGDIILTEEEARAILERGPIFMTVDGLPVCIMAQRALGLRQREILFQREDTRTPPRNV